MGRGFSNTNYYLSLKGYLSGEHTSAEWVGTAHGAFISGLRAAAEIADRFVAITESQYLARIR